MFDKDLNRPAIDPAAGLNDEAVLSCAAKRGRVSARLFKDGDFDEAGFLFYGQLERLCERGLLRFESWIGDPATGPGDVLAVFRPPYAASLAASVGAA